MFIIYRNTPMIQLLNNDHFRYDTVGILNLYKTQGTRRWKMKYKILKPIQDIQMNQHNISKISDNKNLKFKTIVCKEHSYQKKQGANNWTPICWNVGTLQLIVKGLEWEE